MRWELLTLPELENYQVINPARWLSGDLARRIQDNLDWAWSDFLRANKAEATEDYSYCFFTTLCPILYWDYIVESALAEFEPETVWLPARAQSYSIELSSDFFKDRPKFLTWARYASLRQGTKGISTRYFREKSFFDLSLRRGKIARILELAREDKVQAAKRLIRKLISEPLSRKFRSKDLPARIYIVSQATKSELLRQLLDDANMDYVSDSYAQFEARLGVFCNRPLLAVTWEPEVSPQESLCSWLAKMIECHVTVSTPRMEFLNDQLSILMHDAAHHPLIRAATRRLLGSHKQVAYFPEGAQYPSSQSWPFIKNAWGYHFGETRLALSVGEQKFWQAHTHNFGEILVTGYFADSKSRSKFELSNRNQLRADIHSNIKVFFDQWLFSDVSGIGRPAASGFETFPDLVKLIGRLSESNIEMYSNARDIHALVRANAASNGAIRASHLESWDEVLMKCDVLLSCDSSLIVESLSSCKPVVVYRPTWLEQYECNYSIQYQVIQSDVVRYARSPDEVVTAVYELIASPKRDFRKYEYFLAQEQRQAVSWVKEKLGASNSV